MSKHKYMSYLTLLLLYLIQLNCSPDKEQNRNMSQEQLLSRGKYLVDYGGCSDCHTPKLDLNESGPVPDTSRLMSGHPSDDVLPQIDTNLINSKWLYGNLTSTVWVGPWGVSFTANISPDGSTGIGNWTDEIFIKAMRTGKHMGYGRPILPPMPWFSLGSLTDQDLKAVFAYLKSFKPVSNKVPDPMDPNIIRELNKK